MPSSSRHSSPMTNESSDDEVEIDEILKRVNKAPVAVRSKLRQFAQLVREFFEDSAEAPVWDDQDSRQDFFMHMPNVAIGICKVATGRYPSKNITFDIEDKPKDEGKKSKSKGNDIKDVKHKYFKGNLVGFTLSGEKYTPETMQKLAFDFQKRLQGKKFTTRIDGRMQTISLDEDESWKATWVVWGLMLGGVPSRISKIHGWVTHRSNQFTYKRFIRKCVSDIRPMLELANTATMLSCLTDEIVVLRLVYVHWLMDKELAELQKKLASNRLNQSTLNEIREVCSLPVHKPVKKKHVAHWVDHMTSKFNQPMEQVRENLKFANAACQAFGDGAVIFTFGKRTTIRNTLPRRMASVDVIIDTLKECPDTRDLFKIVAGWALRTTIHPAFASPPVYPELVGGIQYDDSPESVWNALQPLFSEYSTGP